MSHEGKAKGYRMDDLNAARPSGYVIKPVAITPTIKKDPSKLMMEC